MIGSSGPASSTAPILILGMHRSGTTLVARTLDALGLFVGWRLAPNHEASFFNRINAWLLASSGGRWDTPEPFDYLLEDADGLELAQTYLEDRLASLPAIEFLGPARYLRHRSLFRLEGPWGWKDPRSTITLALWRRIFPDARVLHVVRNGIDVAASLVRRQRGGLELGRQRLERHRRLLRYLPKKGWFGTSPRLLGLRPAFRLWEEYLSRAERGTEGLGDRLLEMRYESLLARPREEMRSILDFCGLEPAPEILEAQLSGFRPERALAFRNDPDLVRLWQELSSSSPWMKRYGYDHITAPDDPSARANR